MPRLQYRTTFTHPDWLYLTGIADFAVVGSGGSARLYAGGQAAGGIGGFALSDGNDASLIGQWAINGRGSDFVLSDLEVFDSGGALRLLAGEAPTVSGSGAHIEAHSINGSGSLGGGAALSFSGGVVAPAGQMVSFEMGGVTYLATGSPNHAGLQLWERSSTHGLTYQDTLADSEKAALGDVADLAHVVINGEDFLLTASASEDAISLIHVGVGGALTLHDTLTANDGLWVSGPGSVATLSANGVSYGIMGASNSSSLSLVRFTDGGAMVLTDHLTDTLATRFANVSALATFEVAGRGFVLAGGSDDGISLFEVLPDGRLFAHDNVPNELGWTLEDITALEAVNTGSEVQIFAAGNGAPGLTQLVLDASDIAAAQIGGGGSEVMNGTSAHDLLYGAGGNDTLSGGAGEDVLYGGAGADRLTGGAGADVFIFDDSSQRDQVMDFDIGQDQLDIGRWGRIYDPASLTVVSTSDGAILIYGNNSLQIRAGQRLEASDLTADMFLFSGNGLLLEDTPPPTGSDSGALRSNFGGAQGYGETVLARGDDTVTTIDAAALFSGGLDYMGNHYSGAALTIGTNGTLSFGSPFSDRPLEGDSAPIGDIIAPFWADIDTRLSGEGPQSGQIWVDQDLANGTLTITWDQVGAYRYNAGATNSFQLQLTDQGNGDFDITLRYGRIDWVDGSGMEDGGAIAALSGLRLPEAIEIGSDVGTLDSILGNTGVTGVWRYQMRDGTLSGVTLADGLTLLGTAAGEVLAGAGANDILRGFAGADILQGNAGNDWLYGGDGADTLNGGGGDDVIIGGESEDDLRDVIYAGDGDDTIDGGYGNDLVYGGAGADNIAGGFGVDELVGQGGDDVITGSAWSDLIFGGAGNDFLNGGFGFDRLNGGSGADRFYHLGIADHGSDWIQDYAGAEGDVLFYGGGMGAATASDFLVQYSETTGAGAGGVAEAFITHIPSGNLLWALVDGEAQNSINIQIGNQTFDLMG